MVSYSLTYRSLLCSLSTPNLTYANSHVYSYYSVKLNDQVYEDLIWWHKYPATESIGIIGLVSFYNSKVDIYIDGVKESK